MNQQNCTNPPKPAIVKKKKLHDGYYRVMVNLPVIIKDKDLIDRKNTIDVFKRKAATNQKQPSQKKQLQNKKSPDDQIGRIYINELWSDKFHKLVMKESKIQEVLEKISKLYRRNVEDFVDDIHKASIAKNITQDNIITKHTKGYSLPILPKINPFNTNQNQPTQTNGFTILDDIEDQSFMNSDKSLSGIKNKTQNTPKLSVSLPQNSDGIPLGNFERSLQKKFYKRQKDDNLAKPKHIAFSSLISPAYYNSTQNIISKCKEINEEWEMKRQMQKDTIPFYINKDDRY